MAEETQTQNPGDTAIPVGDVPAPEDAARGAEPIEEGIEMPTGAHWFLQEAPPPAGGGRYLKIFANSLVEASGRLSFQDRDGVELIAFEPNEWSFTENGNY